MVRKLVVAVVIEMAFFAGILFLPAGTLHWWRAWVVLGTFVLIFVASMAMLYPSHKDVLEERLKPIVQRGQPSIDKVVTILLIVSFAADYLLIPLDVFRYRWLPSPPVLVCDLGLPIYLAGCYVALLALRENSFAAAIVKHMEERGQKVIDTGVYGVVRHPMYAGGLPTFFAIPLWLQSSTATLFALVPCLLMFVRLLSEERFLRQHLDGYEEYTRRVGYRLIPGIW